MTFTNGGSFPATPATQLSRQSSVEGGMVTITRDPVADPTLWTFKVQVKPTSAANGMPIPVSSVINFAITATDANGDSHVGMASLNIAKVHAGADAEYYELTTTPNRLSIRCNNQGQYVYTDNTVDLVVNHNVGSTTEKVTTGDLYYRFDAVKDWTPAGCDLSTGKAVFTITDTAIHDKITFKWEGEGGWSDSESIPIDKELREVKATKEQFAIDVDGKTVYTDIDESDWKDSIPGNLPEKTKDKCLYNRTYILYKDGTFDISDFENMGKGITEYIEYYAKTNPGRKVVDGDKPTYDSVTWSQFKSDLTENYDCLWNYEKITYRNGEVRQTDVTLTMQLINGVDAYTLTLSNQSPVFTRGKDVKYTCQGYILGGGAKLKPINCVSSIPYKVGTEFFTGEIRGVYLSDGSINLDASTAVYGVDTQYSLTELASKPNKLSVAGGDSDTLTWTYNTEIKDTDTPIFGVIVKYLIGGEPLYQSALLGPSYVSNGRDGLPYIFRGEWKEGKNYYCNDDRVDLVYIVDGDQRKYYRCILTKNGLSTAADKPGTTGGNEYWKAFEGNYENIATGFLLAEEAYIKNLGVEKLQTKLVDEEGKEQPKSIRIEGDSMVVYGEGTVGNENIRVKIHSGVMDKDPFNDPSEGVYTLSNPQTSLMLVSASGNINSYSTPASTTLGGASADMSSIKFKLTRNDSFTDAVPGTATLVVRSVVGGSVVASASFGNISTWATGETREVSIPACEADGVNGKTWTVEYVYSGFSGSGRWFTCEVDNATATTHNTYSGYRSFLELASDGIQLVRTKTQYARCYMDDTQAQDEKRALVTEIRAGSVGLKISPAGAYRWDGSAWRLLDLSKLDA